MIIPYFVGNISATRLGSEGLETTGMGHVVITELIDSAADDPDGELG
jgi:hypothetical protein